MKKQYSKEQKNAYFKQLRAEWQKAKDIANIDEIQAIITNYGLSISPISYSLISMQMNALNLDGIPYLDCKTFQGWKENGFIVKKGEKSQIHGLTWITANNSKSDLDNSEIEDQKDSFLFPKIYHLFHRSQVTEIQS